MYFFVIPAPHQVRDKLQPKSSIFNKLQLLWTPVFTGVTTFYEIILLNVSEFLQETEIIGYLTATGLCDLHGVLEYWSGAHYVHHSNCEAEFRAPIAEP